MPITSANLADGSRGELINFILECRKGITGFSVIDVGGAAGGWSAPYVDAIVDMMPPKAPLPSDVKLFAANINDRRAWQPILDYVRTNGKFKMSLCTHTLEDIAFPALVCEMLPQISEGGFIAVPSKHWELARLPGAPLPYRGWIHHRWIFDLDAASGTFVGYPKLGFVEHLPWADAVADPEQSKFELALWWHDALPYRIVNGDYMGPDEASVIDYYTKLKDS